MNSMPHLNPERLAALIDETPSPIEATHLTTCADCTAEIAAHRKLSRLAVAAQAITPPPLSSFDALVPRLRAEELITAPQRGVMVRRWAIRIAASLVLVTGGVVAGRATASRELPMLPTASVSGNSDASATVTAAPATFKSSDEAVKMLAVSQQSYENAAAFLAAQDTSAHFIGLNQSSYRARLQALDQMAAATRTALYQAPQDPLLNQYYLATLSARKETIRQIGLTMPATKDLQRY
jgi:hypothetical protein